MWWGPEFALSRLDRDVHKPGKELEILRLVDPCGDHRAGDGIGSPEQRLELATLMNEPEFLVDYSGDTQPVEIVPFTKVVLRLPCLGDDVSHAPILKLMGKPVETLSPATVRSLRREDTPHHGDMQGGELHDGLDHGEPIPT